MSSSRDMLPQLATQLVIRVTTLFDLQRGIIVRQVARKILQQISSYKLHFDGLNITFYNFILNNTSLILFMRWKFSNFWSLISF